MLAVVNTPKASMPAELREVDPPQPEPDEAVIQVQAFSINRGELSLLGSRPEGWRPGQDIAGVVQTVAADGSGPPAGTRVMALVESAGWSQLAAAPASRLTMIDDSVDIAHAAATPMVGITALRALRLGGNLHDRRVLITGATGGVGRCAVQLAYAAGAVVTALVSSVARREGLQALGVCDVVTSMDELPATAFDLILDAVGGSSLEATSRLIAPNGMIVVYGNSSGEPSRLSFFDFAGSFPDGASMRFFVHSSGSESFASDLARLADKLASGTLTPSIGADTSWRALSDVVQSLRERRVEGKAILRVD